MPIGSAFHPRTLPLASSLSFRDWAGYFAVSAFETHHEHEYNAIRNGCALIDISPLFKYHLHGPDALRLVDRLITRDASALAVGQVYYTPWCDDDGQVIDDGTVARLAEHGGTLIGETVQYEDKYRLCYVRGPAGIIVALAQPLKLARTSSPRPAPGRRPHVH